MKNRIDLAKHFYDRGFTTGFEIGVLKGSYSRVLCGMNSRLHLYGVDSWGIGEARKKDYHERMFEKAKTRLAPFGKRITLIKSLSMDAVKQFEIESVDFVYIDGSHKFDLVMEDIIEWTKIVKKGGIVSGDDYNRFVQLAVDVYVKAHGYTLNLTKEDSNWWFTK